MCKGRITVVFCVHGHLKEDAGEAGGHSRILLKRKQDLGIIRYCKQA